MAIENQVKSERKYADKPGPSTLSSIEKSDWREFVWFNRSIRHKQLLSLLVHMYIELDEPVS